MEKLTDRDYNLDVVPGDELIASFPKSGNTWVQWLVFFLFNATDDALQAVSQFSEDNPELCVVEGYYASNRGISRLRESHRHVVIKTHSIFRVKFSKCRVLYVVRDPRDVAISYFHYYSKLIGNDIKFGEFLVKYIDGDIHPLFGSWNQHAGSWWGAMNGDERHFHLVRYEDLLDDPFPVIEGICRFFGFDRSSEQIANAIQRASFGNLKQREMNVRKIESDSPLFFRKGTTGQWATELTEADKDLIEARFGPMMLLLGYR